MSGFTPPRLSKWPFFLGDTLLLGMAVLLLAQSRLPLGPWEVLACSLCVAVGAGCGVLPFILEYRVLVKLILADHLVAVASDIRKLEQLAASINAATGRWQSIQESADKTAQLATGIADRMGVEIRQITQSLQLAQENEKAALRLEVEKLRRAEGDWLQVLVGVLDHVYALHQAALRSQQPSLIAQLGQFQNACRDAARWVGLAPFVAAPEEPFDKQRHQLVDGNGTPPPDALVAETVATGYTFQGRLLRPALVRLRDLSGPARTTPFASPEPRPSPATRPTPNRESA